jgi:hypothetical protein
MRSVNLTISVLIGLLMLGIACREEKAAWTGKIEIVNGVTNVSNPVRPKFENRTLVLDEELSIGEDKGRPEYIFSGIGGLAVDEQGNIYAIDSREAVVRVFDQQGRYVRTIGRRGQGPGETQYPVFVQITTQGELAVYDYSVARMLFYSLDGTYLRQKTTPRPVMPIGLDSQGGLIAQYILAPPPLGGKLILKLDRDYSSEQELAREEKGKERGLFDIGRPTCYVALSPSDMIIWGDSNQYDLHILNADGELVMRIIKEFNPLNITSEEENEYRQKYAEPLKAGMTISFRGKWPAFSGLFVDDEGSIFVRTYERAGGGANSFYYDVFSKDGVFESKVVMPITLDKNSVWKNGRVYTVERDDNGLPLVKIYRITWRTARQK